MRQRARYCGEITIRRLLHLGHIFASRLDRNGVRARLEAFIEVCFHGKGKESRNSGLKRGGKFPCLRLGGGRRRKGERKG